MDRCPTRRYIFLSFAKAFPTPTSFPLYLSQPSAPVIAKHFEPAGAKFHFYARLQTGEEEWTASVSNEDEEDSEELGSASEGESEDDEEIRVAGVKRPKKPKSKNKDKEKEPKKERDDLYKYLALENERWMATEVRGRGRVCGWCGTPRLPCR